MQLFARILGIFIVAMTLSTPAWSADVAKIGLVHFQRVVETSDAGKAAQEKINAQGLEMKMDLENRGKALQEERDQFENVEKLALDADAQKKRADEINQKIRKFQQLQEQYSKKARKLQIVHINKIRKDIARIGQVIGKREGYLLVIEKQEAGVIYAPTALDITEQLIKEYNREFNASNKKK